MTDRDQAEKEMRDCWTRGASPYAMAITERTRVITLAKELKEAREEIERL